MSVLKQVLVGVAISGILVVLFFLPKVVRDSREIFAAEVQRNFDRGRAEGMELGYKEAVVDAFQGKARYQVRETGDGRAEVWSRNEIIKVKTDLPLPSNDLLPDIKLPEPPTKSMIKKK